MSESESRVLVAVGYKPLIRADDGRVGGWVRIHYYNRPTTGIENSIPTASTSV